MGLFSKHKTKGVNYKFSLRVHALSPFPATWKALAVEWHRGKNKSGSSRAVGPARQAGRPWATFEFEETLTVPCTLYLEAGASGRAGGKGQGRFERKDIEVIIVDASSGGGSGKQRPALGTATLNLADFAGEGVKLQQALPVVLARGVAAVGGTPKLLVTVSCGGHEGSIAPTVGGRSSLEEMGDVPATMSTDDESSRPSSRVETRPSSRLEESPSALGLLPKAPAGVAAAAAAAGNGSGSWRRRGEAPLSSQQEERGGAAGGGRTASRGEATYDSEGFLRDDSEELEPNDGPAEAAAGRQRGSQQQQERGSPARPSPAAAAALQPQRSGLSGSAALTAGGSVKRNLGSALERVDSTSSQSESSRPDGEEVQSRPLAAAPTTTAAATPGAPSPLKTEASAAPARSVAASTAAAIGGGAAAAIVGAAGLRMKDGNAEQNPASLGFIPGDGGPAALPTPPHPPSTASAAAAAAASGEPDTPFDARLAADLASPPPWSTGQSSLSAGVDPAVPFTVRPSTVQRRFVREDSGTAAPRRWMWRHQQGGSARASPERMPARGATAVGAGAAAQQLGEAEASGAAGEALAAEAFREGDADSHADVAAGLGGKPSSPSSPFHAMAVAAAAGAAAAAAAGDATHPPDNDHDGRNQGSPPLPPLARPSSPGEAAAAGSPAPRPLPVAAAPAAAGGSLARPSADVGALAGGPRPPRRASLGLQSSREFHLPPSREESLLAALATPRDSLAAELGAGHGQLEGLLRELLTTAVLESAVYLAAGKSTFRPPLQGATASDAAAATSKHVHAPARRLARTALVLGRYEGRLLMLRAIKAIQAVSGAGAGDLHRLSFWWSNVLQLRWMTWALQDPAAGPADAAAEPDFARANGSSHAAPHRAGSGPSEGSWVSEVLVPALLDLETQLFGEMLRILWWGVLLPTVTGRSLGGSLSRPSPGRTPAKANGIPQGSQQQQQQQQQPVQRHSSGPETPSTAQGTPRSLESAEEAAVRQWVIGLEACVEVLGQQPHRPAPAPRGHLLLLHRQLLVGLLRRLDTLLFRKLLSGPEVEGRETSFSSRSLLGSSSFMEDVLGGSSLPLNPSLLPFPRGPLTFSVGVNLKMAVSRLTQWAADNGIKEDRVARSSHELSDYRLFPCLRATADLLMMPKEVLADSEIRREVVPGLPLRRVVQILERFEPDDFAPEPVPPDLLEQLQDETPTSAAALSPTVKRSEEYTPPSEAGLLEEGLIGASVSLKMDDESEDELEALAETYACGGEEGGNISSGEARAHRFALLRDLWSGAH